MARLAFLGTPEVSVITLMALLEAGHEIAIVISGPDARRGRGGEQTPSPVKQAALAAGLIVSDNLEDLHATDIEAAVVVAYGRIIPDSLLAAVPMINLHFSSLPRWRGAAPVERAILAGDSDVGVCVMKIESELDTGPIYASATVPTEEKTATNLRNELGVLGSHLLLDLLASGVSALRAPIPQQGEVTYAKKISKAEGVLDFMRPAEELNRVIRVGIGYTTFNGRRLRILEASLGPSLAAPPGVVVGSAVATSEGSLQMGIVQPEGKRAMSAEDWVNGVQGRETVRLGVSAKL